MRTPRRLMMMAEALLLVAFFAVVTAHALPTVTVGSATRNVVAPGESLNLSVTASGSGSLTYQWLKKGQAVPGATGQALAINNAAYSDAGWYVVDVTDGTGTTRSAPMFVLVAPASTQIRSWGTNAGGQAAIPIDLGRVVAICSGDPVKFAVRADGTVAAWGDYSPLVDHIPADLTDAVAVASSHFGSGTHVLVLRSDGTVTGWGGSFWGALDIPPGLSGVVSLVSGGGHALALKSDGTVVAWGRNDYGQATVPPGLNGVVAVAAGNVHSLALKADGTVVGWGNFNGGLAALPPAGLTNVVAIAGGYHASAALRGDGTVVTWGYFSFGEDKIPAGLANVTAISMGSIYVLALKSDGKVVGWGYDGDGPAVIPADLADVVALDAGAGDALALRDAAHDAAPVITTQPGPVTTFVAEGRPLSLTVAATGTYLMHYQWRKDGVPLAGQTNLAFSLAHAGFADAGSYDVVVSNHVGSVTSVAVNVTVRPNPVVTLQGSTRNVLTVGQNLQLGVTATGNGVLHYQWIHNGRQISGATSTSLTVNGAGVMDSGWYVAAVTDDFGKTYSAPFFVLASPALTQLRPWGTNQDGQATLPAGLTDVVAISAGTAHMVALKKDGTVVAWGQNYYGQTDVPADLTDVVAIGAGDKHSLALKSDGTVVAWGAGPTAYSDAAKVPPGLNGVVAIATLSGYSLALKNDGTVVAWGDLMTGYASPAGLDSVCAIAAGIPNALAIKQDGTLVNWPAWPNSGGSPPPPFLGTYKSVTAGYNFIITVRDTGTVAGWAGYGGNDYGQTNIPPGLGDVTAIAAGATHVLALRSDGSVVAWGDNSKNQATIPAWVDHTVAITAGAYFSYALRDASQDTVPTIAAQPANLRLPESERATFSVSVTGAGPFSYQWRHNGTNIPGATSASLVLEETLLTDAGNYDVVVTNHIGSTTSNVATLQVDPVAVITSLSPARQVINPGAPLQLSVTATGTGALTYQWLHDGRIVPGATGNTLAIANASLADKGWYRVLITDSVGTRRSALMFVLIAPPVTQMRTWGDYPATLLPSPPNLTDAIAICLEGAQNSRAYAVRRDGTVVGWGTGTAGAFQVPADLTDVVSITGSSSYMFALKSDGTVVGWGSPNGYENIENIPPGLKNVVAISAAAHALALKADGTVVSWGYNPQGQATVPDSLSNVRAVAVGQGGLFSVALKQDGTVVAWGYTGYGSTDVPVDLANVVKIAAGSEHGLALKGDDTIVVWGGTGTGAAEITQSPVNVDSIAGGYAHSLALLGDGTVWTDSTTATLVPPSDLSGVIDISAGGYVSGALVDPARLTAPVITTQPQGATKVERESVTFAVKLYGQAPFTYQWRRNGVAITGATGSSLTIPRVLPGSAGNYDVVITNSLGTVTSAPAALVVKPLPVVTALSDTRQVLNPGQSLNLSVTATGAGPLTYQWLRNGWPIAGATTSTLIKAEVTYADAGWYVVDITDQIGTRRSRAIFVTVAPAATRVMGWGDNIHGQINVPTGLKTAVSVTVGQGGISLAVKSNGTVSAWGNWSDTNLPGFFSAITDGVAAVSGENYALVLRSDGTVAGWNCSPPFGLTDVAAVAAGGHHSLALQTDGTVVGWEYTGTPTKVPAGLSDVVAISAGVEHSLALKRDGTVVAWNTDGSRRTDVPAGLSNVVGIVAGGYQSYALKSDGTVVAWGNNSSGQCNVPAGLTGVVSLASGYNHVVALTASGNVVGWGDNYFGETTPPVDLPGVLAISAGGYSSLALCGAGAPTFVQQPVGTTAIAGSSVSFTTSMTGALPATYQWRRNGINIPGATGATLTIDNTTAMNAGDYSVVVTNSFGSVTSNVATLTVKTESSIWLMDGIAFKFGVSLGYRDSNWQLVTAADFNGDNKPDILLQNVVTGECQVQLLDGANQTSTINLGTVDPNWQMVAAADFNGDSKPDIVLQNTVTGQRSLWLMNGTTYVWSADLGTYDLSWRIATAADFDGDGKADLLWQNTVTGQCTIWLMNGTQFIWGVDLGTYDLKWRMAAVADFDGDGKVDIIWQDAITGQRNLWLMNGTQFVYGVDLGTYDLGWRIVAVADFDRDGKKDILWQRMSFGQTGTADLGTLDTNWKMAGTADFNGDHNPDIVWQNLATGQRSIWLMNGSTFSYSADLGTVDINWQIAAIADFNHDGQPDLVWQNVSTGQRSIWLMNGIVAGSTVSLGVVDPNWTIATAADFNADGNPDIVWQNLATGQRGLWLMDGTSYFFGIDLGTVDTSWRISAAADFTGDGKPDLLWRNTTTGQATVWRMNGVLSITPLDFGTYDLNLQCVGAADFDHRGGPDLLWQNTVTGQRSISFISGSGY